MTIPVSGMHCRSCEILVEDSLSEIKNVEKSTVDHKQGTVEIQYDEKKPNVNEIEKAIKSAGYAIGENDKKTFLSKNHEDYKDLGIAVLFLIGLYIIAKNLGFTNLSFAGASNPSGLGVVFLVGLTAGLSTCMALVGGFILGISARHAEKHPNATPMQKFRPHLFFNLGRIGGYALLGGILGAIGSAVQFSAGTLGVMTLGVGLVMLGLGIKLIGIFPRMEDGGLTLPKGISRALGIKNNNKEYNHGGAMITGALTFFLPCGFTQAMQLYAVSTGSFLQGALIMGMFALGTAPGLLSIGGLTSAVKGVFAKRFFKFAGVLVISLAFFNITNGYNLIGWQIPAISHQSSVISNNANDPNVIMLDGVQVVSMIENASGYSPNKFTIRKGVKVRWEIDAQAPSSCASSLVSPKLGVQKTLKAGKNVIEFIPTETGEVPFSCSMGMYTGMFNVVDEKGNGAANIENESVGDIKVGTCTMNGCGMRSIKK